MNIVITLAFVGYLLAGFSPLENGYHNSPVVEGKPSKLILFHIENQHLTPLEGVIIATSTDTFVTDSAGDAAVPVSWTGIGEAPAPYGFFITGPSIVNSPASISLSVNTEADYTLSIYDIVGRMLYSRSVHLAPGMYGLSVSLPRNGIFYIVVRSHEGVLLHKLINLGSSGLALELSPGSEVFKHGAEKSDTLIEFTVWDTLRQIENFPIDTIIAIADSAPDTVEVDLTGMQYWNVDLSLMHPNGNNFPAGQVVYVIANPDGRVDTLTTDSTGSVSFRDYGLGGSFSFHVWGDENIVFDTTINNVNSDTGFSFIAPQNIYVNLPDSVSFPEDSLASVPFVVNAPFGYDSVNVYSSNGVVNTSINGDSLTISGNPNANGVDDVVFTVYGSEGTTKQDTMRVNVEPRSDVYLKVVNSDLTGLTDFDSVRVDVKDHDNVNSYVFNPNDVLHLQFIPNDTINFYIGGYQGDSLGSFVSHYYQIIPNNDVNDTTLARIFPYENFRRSDYYGNAIAPKDSVLMFMETASASPMMGGTVDFDHVQDSLPSNFPVPPDSAHGMKIIIFRNINLRNINPDVFPYEDGTSLTQEQVDSIQTWIINFFTESNSLSNMPKIVVADLQDSEDWYQYFQYEGPYFAEHPGEIIIYGSNAPNAYAAYNDFNDNAQGYIYRGGASVAAYNLFQGATMQEFLTTLIIPNEMDPYYYTYPGYSVTISGGEPTYIDREMLHLAETIKYWTNGFGVPLVLGQDSVNINDNNYPVLKVSAGTYFNGMEHDNGMFFYDFPNNNK